MILIASHTTGDPVSVRMRSATLPTDEDGLRLRINKKVSMSEMRRSCKVWHDIIHAD